MEDKINNLKKMIEEAKLENDEKLIEYLSKALNHLLKKQKESEDIKLKSQENINQEENKNIEEKQEVVIENKKDEEEKKEENPIKKQGHGEVSTITVYQNGKVSLDTKYLDIPIKGNKTELISAMRRIGINLGIDDVTNDKSAQQELLDIMDKFYDEEDIDKIEDFLDEAAKVGIKGQELKEKYYAGTLERKELPYDAEYQELLKAVAWAMDEDRENNKHNVDTNKYEETILAYQKLLVKLQNLIDEAKNKMSREKIANLEMKVMQIQDRIKNMEETLKMVDETNYIFD